ncbi:MAG: hypothetical protein PHP54_05820 [Clostridia bacterium]|nr:hypothetical protein [Clostridia bacterium]
METMRYQENKKSSKAPIIAFFSFVIIGGALIFLALTHENEPTVIGQDKSDVQNLLDLSQDESVPVINLADIEYSVADNKISDTSNAKIKADITIPVVTLGKEKLEELNKKIDDQYTQRYVNLKDQMKSADHKYTFTVSYNNYDNTVNDKRILSLTLHQRIIDDAAKKSTTEKIECFNINLETGKEITEKEILVSMLGKDYKMIVKNSVKGYVVSKKLMNESDFTYALTGLENFYIKDEKVHIIFNEGDLVDKKHGVLDITIEEE